MFERCSAVWISLCPRIYNNVPNRTNVPETKHEILYNALIFFIYTHKVMTTHNVENAYQYSAIV